MQKHYEGSRILTQCSFTRLFILMGEKTVTTPITILPYYEQLKSKVNVKDDDSCSTLMVYVNHKDDKTKCIVKNDYSILIVSRKLPSSKLKTSNPKKMMSSLLMKSLQSR